jgi:hypothetical protein
VTSISKRTATLAVCCSCLTHIPQAAAAARIVGQPDIITAVGTGNLSLVKDHVLADETSVNKKDSLYITLVPPQKVQLLYPNLVSFFFNFSTHLIVFSVVTLHYISLPLMAILQFANSSFYRKPT